MLPSMPVLFSRESQDAFGNKLEPTTTFLPQNILTKTPCKQETQIIINGAGTSNESPKESKEPIGKIKNESDKPKVNENQLETALVRSYYSKVRSRFSSSSLPVNKFAQFRMILKAFDPGKDTPVDLYRKIEELFGDEHKDIVEEFLLFLKPGQAAEVGRFMDHFVLTQLTSFIVLLQKTIGRKPTVYRKILRAITAGINNGSSQEMRSRVLPHLRSNPKLAQVFKSLFPDERPPDSAYEGSTDLMDESCLECDKGYDVWEFELEDKKRQLDVKDGLDSAYLHGRVFLQHGKLLRSACVTYPYSKEPYRVHWRRLAPNTFLSPTDSEEERSTKRNRNRKVPPKKSRKQTKSPTKTVKDVNDNTKKDIKQVKVKGKTNDKKKVNDKRVKELKMSLKKEDKKPKDAKSEVKSWTREEDKTMLEVLKGEGGSDKVLVRVCELLPHRSQTEVKERFCHVMNLLQQMAVNAVT
ncbi:uncharacterized protein LOC125053033 [Pieris napi]|uniref:uncharacterized protein LOC125053033 n=1 Tax=Pieris napi TaxID=78633 RepID=UPI001FBB44AA|nr:uncharacterized protein LOC125053033 [Pieris napi]